MADTYLAHYASKYYDPVKAHEYYMRTRELKGRRLTKNLSDEGKKVWSYTKNEISSEKKSNVENQRDVRDKKIEEMRSKASAARERITAKLKELNKVLSEKASEQRENIDSNKKSNIEEITSRTAAQRDKLEAEKNAKIKQFMAEKIPEGLSKEERAKRIAERNEEIAKLRHGVKGEKLKITEKSAAEKDSVRTAAKNDKTVVNESTKAERTSNQSSASSERAAVASELKNAITAARNAYNQAKVSLDSSYESIYQREFDKIASEYVKVSSQKKNKRKRKNR